MRGAGAHRWHVPQRAQAVVRIEGIIAAVRAVVDGMVHRTVDVDRTAAGRQVADAAQTVQIVQIVLDEKLRLTLLLRLWLHLLHLLLLVVQAKRKRLKLQSGWRSNRAQLMRLLLLLMLQKELLLLLL